MDYILVTGGLGYIGSHVSIQLIQQNFNIIIIDNLSNSQMSILKNIKKITNTNNILFFEIDLINSGDLFKLESIFNQYKINSVIHLAGYKSVNNSIKFPIEYYQNNIGSACNILNIMKKSNCKKFIFSSSSTVYGNQNSPLQENMQTGISITNPYGYSKFIIEKILQDLYNSDPDFSICILRYFNPIGCHESGLIGEDIQQTPNNLFPYILRTAFKMQNYLEIYGNDYPTPDGTCIRDFIHVDDVAAAHIASISKLNNPGYNIYNIATGKGISVLELVKKFISINNIPIRYVFTKRRPGDLPISYADNSKIKQQLGFQPTRTIEQACQDSYNYIKNSLNNY